MSFDRNVAVAAGAARFFAGKARSFIRSGSRALSFLFGLCLSMAAAWSVMLSPFLAYGEFAGGSSQAVAHAPSAMPAPPSADDFAERLRAEVESGRLAPVSGYRSGRDGFVVEYRGDGAAALPRLEQGHGKGSDRDVPTGGAAKAVAAAGLALLVPALAATLAALFLSGSLSRPWMPAAEEAAALAVGFVTRVLPGFPKGGPSGQAALAWMASKAGSSGFFPGCAWWSAFGLSSLLGGGAAISSLFLAMSVWVATVAAAALFIAVPALSVFTVLPGWAWTAFWMGAAWTAGAFAVAARVFGLSGWMAAKREDFEAEGADAGARVAQRSLDCGVQDAGASRVKGPPSV